MSRKKSKQNGKQKPAAPSPPSPVIPTPNTAQAATDAQQDRRITWSLAGTILSLVVSLASAYFAYRSANEAKEANKIARTSLDRTAGRVQARFEFVDEKNRDPERDKPFLRKKDGYDQQVFRIESADEMLRWGPYVRIKNTGTEPIDAIKISVNYEFSAAYGKGVQQIYPAPIIFSEEGSHEFTTFGKLMPEQIAKISIAPLLALQISKLKWPEYTDKDQTGVFTVNAHCRLVGSSSYDRIDDSQRMVFNFHWRPAGFANNAKGIKELLEIKPWIKIE